MAHSIHRPIYSFYVFIDFLSALHAGIVLVHIAV